MKQGARADGQNVRDSVALGALVRARRKAAGLTQAQAAGLAGVGNRFFSELERGKATLELGLVLQVLDRLGLELTVAPRGSMRRGPPPSERAPSPVKAKPRRGAGG